MSGLYLRSVDSRYRVVLPPPLRRALPPCFDCVAAPGRRLVLVADAGPLLRAQLILSMDVFPVRVLDGPHQHRWMIPAGFRSHLGARCHGEVWIAGDGARCVVAVEAGQLRLPMPEGW